MALEQPSCFVPRMVGRHARGKTSEEHRRDDESLNAVGRGGNPDLCLARKGRTLPQDANHGVRGAVEEQRLTERSAVSAELALPEPIRDNRQARIDVRLFRRERPPDVQLRRERLPEARRHRCGTHPLGRVAAEIERAARMQRDSCQHRAFAELGRRERQSCLVQSPQKDCIARALDVDETIGLAIRQLTQQQHIHNAEHRDVDADAQCERDRRPRGKSGTAAQARARQPTDRPAIARRSLRRATHGREFSPVRRLRLPATRGATLRLPWRRPLDVRRQSSGRMRRARHRAPARPPPGEQH